MLNHAQPVDLGQPKDDSTSIAAPYDPRKRDPQFAGAEGHCFWDLVNGSPYVSLEINC